MRLPEDSSELFFDSDSEVDELEDISFLRDR
jgi:hypothetical protein